MIAVGRFMIFYTVRLKNLGASCFPAFTMIGGVSCASSSACRLFSNVHYSGGRFKLCLAGIAGIPVEMLG